MLKFWKYGKYIENQDLNKRQYCFANISATKASIFMKLKTFIHEIVKNCQINFRKYPCIYTRTRGVNVRARVLSRQNTRAHVFTLCARVCAWIFTKNLLHIGYYLMKLCLQAFWGISHIFQIGRNFDAQILKICKLHRKLRIKQLPLLFCKYLRN